jgi:Concanavalin A-like lectin/glucanases superfamily
VQTALNKLQRHLVQQARDLKPKPGAAEETTSRARRVGKGPTCEAPLPKELQMRFLAITTVAATLMAGALAAAARAGVSGNYAAALRWPGYVDTDLPYSSFFTKNFTITARFMLQYPRAYRGPIISVSDDSGSFEVGQGDYRSFVTGVKLNLKVGGSENVFYSNALAAGKWQHLALVRQFTSPFMSNYGSSFTLYLNGQKLCVATLFSCGDSVWIGGSGPAAPAGSLRIGRTSTSQAGLTQFYGLVDDVAVFSQALSATTIQALAAKSRLDGGEQGLLRGWTFDNYTPSGAPLPAALDHPAQFNQGAVPTGVSQTRDDAADAGSLPLPDPFFPQPALRLPFKSGQPWVVTQGWGATLSHNGYAAFSLDFALADPAQTTPGKVFPPKPADVTAYPNYAADASCGEPVYAGYPGSIIWASDNGHGTEDATDPQNDSINNDYDGPDYLTVEQGPYSYATYMHTLHGSIAAAFPGWYSYYAGLPPWTPSIPIQTGTKLGVVGTRNICHLHFSLGNSGSDNPFLPPPQGVTYPVAFSNYTACDSQCTNAANWYWVGYGVPTQGQWVKAP